MRIFGNHVVTEIPGYFNYGNRPGYRNEACCRAPSAAPAPPIENPNSGIRRPDPVNGIPSPEYPPRPLSSEINSSFEPPRFPKPPNAKIPPLGEGVPGGVSAGSGSGAARRDRTALISAPAASCAQRAKRTGPAATFWWHRISVTAVTEISGSYRKSLIR